MIVPKNIFITGANRGIGFEFVRQLTEVLTDAAAANIFATFRDRESAGELHKLATSCKSIRPIRLDVRDVDVFPKIVDQVSSVVGDNGINLLIHNSGFLKAPGDFKHVTKADLMLTYETNAVAPVLLTKACLPLLRAGEQSGRGPEFTWTRSAVVIISSIFGSPTFMKTGGFPYAYSMSKAAVNLAAKSLSFDLESDRILVVAIHPGHVKTDMGQRVADAPMTTFESVQMMLDTFSRLTLENNGTFIKFNGHLLRY